MNKRYSPVIGVDIGGTNIKLGVVQGKRILLQKVLATRRIAKSPKTLQAGLVESIRGLMQEAGLKHAPVGIGIPGLVCYPKGEVNSCANLPGWKAVPLRKNMERALGVSVRVDNDVHAMTLAEWTFGAGRGAQHLVCVTLGTGVGGGLVLQGALYRGHRGAVGEVGHLPLAPAGPLCACGGRACLERYVGNREIIHAVRRKLRAGRKSMLRDWIQAGEPLTPELIDRACVKGDRLALETWNTAGTRIGQVLAGVVNLVDPECIVIGGGIAKAGRWLFVPLRKAFRNRVIHVLRDVPIVPAQCGEMAGLLGAGLLAQGVGD